MHPATAHLLLGGVHVLHNKKDQDFTTALKLGLYSGQLFLFVLANINIQHIVCLQQGCSSSRCVWFRHESIKQNRLDHAVLLSARSLYLLMVGSILESDRQVIVQDI